MAFQIIFSLTLTRSHCPQIVVFRQTGPSINERLNHSGAGNPETSMQSSDDFLIKSVAIITSGAILYELRKKELNPFENNRARRWQ